MRPAGPPKKYLEKKSTATASDSDKQSKRKKGEMQKLELKMNTPLREPDAQQRSPVGCLRRREKKSRSRAALLECLDGSESQILQRLDFTGCSDDEVDARDVQDENTSSFLNVETETTPPVTLKRKVPQSNELSAAAKRKKLPPRPKVLVRSVEHNRESERHLTHACSLEESQVKEDSRSY